MREGVGFGRSPKAAAKNGPLCQAIEARTCVSANDGNVLLVIAPHAVFRDGSEWRLAGAIIEENGAIIQPPRWAVLEITNLSYIMPTKQRFERHPDYDESDGRFNGEGSCRLVG
jgi:hypothetical protein